MSAEGAAAGGQGGAGLSFGFAKKKVAQKVGANVEEQKNVGQVIKGIEGSRIQVEGPEPGADAKTFIIPKIDNTYRTGGVGAGTTGPKKFTPSFRPPASADNDPAAAGEDKFVQGVNTVPVIAEFGLQRREAPAGGRSGGDAAATGPRLTPAQLEDRAYKDHVEELPEDPNLEVSAQGGQAVRG